MGKLSMLLKSKYDLKDSKQFDLAVDEIKQAFDEELKAHSEPIIPLIDNLKGPEIEQIDQGFTHLNFRTTMAMDVLLISLIEQDYLSHPQPAAGIWGTARAFTFPESTNFFLDKDGSKGPEINLARSYISIKVPSQPTPDKQKISLLVNEVLNLAATKWVLQKRREVEKKRAAVKQAMSLELADLEALRDLL